MSARKSALGIENARILERHHKAGDLVSRIFAFKAASVIATIKFQPSVALL
jgi:hypothetical protein